MNVIGLDRKFDDPELGARGRGEGAAHGREDPSGAEAADGVHGPERDVEGMGGDVPGAGPVRHAGPPSGRGLATGARPAPAPGRRSGQGELEGSARHLIRLIYYSSYTMSSGTSCVVGRARPVTTAGACARIAEEPRLTA